MIYTVFTRLRKQYPVEKLPSSRKKLSTTAKKDGII
jgi:hypothetical protein